MKIVFLDDNSIGTDIDLSGFESLGEVVRYGSSKPEEVPERVKDADVVITDGSPFEVMTEVRAVFIDGEMIRA